MHILKIELLFSFVDRMVGKLEQRFCSVDSGLQKKTFRHAVLNVRTS